MAKASGAAPAVLGVLGVLIGAGVGSAGVYVWLSGKHQGDLGRLRQQVQEQEARSLEAANQAQAARAEMETLKSERAELQKKVASLGDDLKQTQVHLRRATDDLKEAQDRYARMSQQHERLEGELATLQNELSAAEKVADEAQSLQETLNRQLRRYRNQYQVLDRDYSKVMQRLQEIESQQLPLVQRVADTSIAGQTLDLPLIMDSQKPMMSIEPRELEGERESYRFDAAAEKSVLLEKVVVDREQEGKHKDIRAAVIEVDIPNRFVVIDKGSADGVRAGMEFDVMHGRERISRLRVIRTRGSLSACDILEEHTTDVLTPGDVAVYNVPPPSSGGAGSGNNLFSSLESVQRLE